MQHFAHIFRANLVHGISRTVVLYFFTISFSILIIPSTESLPSHIIILHSFISQVAFFSYSSIELHALHNRRRGRHFQANFSRKSAIRDSKQPTESVIISISQSLLSQAKRQQATSGVEMNWQSIISLIDNGRIISSSESICRGLEQAAVSNSP